MRVLVVDDEEKIRNLLKLYLEKESWTVEVADNGKDAAEKALASDFDVILLDMLLPEMNGIEVLQEIRKEKTTPIIMLTAQTDDDSMEVTELLGVNGYISKPFSPKEVINHIHSII